jgi:GNAT superfamily N-acetyltransferase
VHVAARFGKVYCGLVGHRAGVHSAPDPVGDPDDPSRPQHKLSRPRRAASSMTIEVHALTGPALDAVIDDVARLRREVFSEWPFLYDGRFDYERAYIETYRDHPGALLIGAFHEGRLIGASTSTPLEDHAEAFAPLFAPMGIALSAILYGAESVLLPPYRGIGLGHRFIDLREAHARALNRNYVAFCSVIRPPDHPARPANARSNEAFWRGRGYAPLPGVVAEFAWKDLGAAEETTKPLQFWMREL